ncbi:hypothetical protein GGX14DRAFT_395340 [Mycena pura]|uniref:Uncharacterized protein n=1 Tax=Mycena pura TaxID=153505 RepID=A0AAD6VGU6_9AGAR|nr:hypothetical protein GGX14DRAFT_395340 [Mycena pura]
MSPLHRDPLLVAAYAVLMLATTIALPYSVAFRYNAADPGTGAPVEKETLRNRQGWQCRELPMLWCIQLSTSGRFTVSAALGIKVASESSSALVLGHSDRQNGRDIFELDITDVVDDSERAATFGVGVIAISGLILNKIKKILNGYGSAFDFNPAL